MSGRTVLEVTDYAGPYPGNFIPSLIATGRAVRERLGLDYRCTFPAQMRDRPWVGMLHDAGIEVGFLDGARPRRERLAQVAAAARVADAALVRSHFTGWDMEATLVARRLGIPVLWHIHTRNAHAGPRQQLSNLLKVRGMGRAWCDRVIAVSEGIAEESVQRGFRPEQVTLVPNGIDMARFADAALPPRDAARAALGLDPEDRVLLAFGWHPHVKGIDVLVRAVGEPAPMERVVVLLVGTEAARAALPSPPPWLRLLDPVQDPRPLFAAADVFVSASRQEGFSYAIGEAMAMRLPVVSSRIPGPTAYFPADGVSTYPVEDAGALRAAVAAVLDDPGRERLGEANRAFVATRLGLDSHVGRVLEILAAELAA